MNSSRNSRHWLAVAAALLATGFTASAADAPASNTVRRYSAPGVRFPKTEVRYTHGPDSQRKEGVPRGKVTDFDWTNSTIFPNTIRHCSIYVPAQYDAAKPAALMIFQDGHTYQKEDGDFRVPVVFDNLIAAKEMPVTIAVFLDPGFKLKEFPKPPPGAGSRSRSNRSFEYDSLTTNYSAFIVE